MPNGRSSAPNELAVCKDWSSASPIDVTVVFAHSSTAFAEAPNTTFDFDNCSSRFEAASTLLLTTWTNPTPPRNDADANATERPRERNAPEPASAPRNVRSTSRLNLFAPDAA